MSRPLARLPAPRSVAAALLGLALLGAAPLSAQDLALIVANERYAALPQVAGADAARATAEALQRQGFTVIQVRDTDSGALAAAIDRFATAEAAAEGTPRVAVLLLGQFASSSRDAFLLATDSATAPTLPQAARSGLPLSVLWPLLERHQGRAVVLLGGGEAPEESAGAHLGFGLAGLPAPPNGVTVIHGPAAEIGWLAQNVLTREGLRLAESLVRQPELTAAGFLPDDLVFLPAAPDAAGPPPVPDPNTEELFWQASRRADTQAGYDAYLRRYPNGAHADEARRLIEEIRTEPDRPARLAEEALGLDRARRRELQEVLKLLDHDPRGVDGILGPGSRAAIRAWQLTQGAPATGYLTREQVAALLEQGRVRRAQRDAEAAERRQAAEQEDRAYWEATGAVGDEAGLRAYLDRYPKGEFAAVANERLAAFEARARALAEAAERRAWEEARREDTAAAYRAHLTRWPDGLFAAEARRRLAELEAPPGPAAGEDGTPPPASPEGAEASAEAALGLGTPARLLIEQRLAALGLAPGPVDGVFDASTRRALSVWQETQGLRATGYLDQAALLQLLAGSLLSP